MNKQTVRILFTGDNAEKYAAWLHKNIKLSGFYQACELDPRHEDAVMIEIHQIDRLTQVQYLFTLLQEVNSYHFVGPECPYGPLDHPKTKRFMFQVNALHMSNGDEFMCFGCRKKMPMTYGEGFIDQRDLKMILTLDTLQKVRPMPHPRERTYGGPKLDGVTATTITGRTSYNKPSGRYFHPMEDMSGTMKKPDITKKEQESLSQQLLGCDYKTIEFATLFHSLGMRHTIDVKTMKDIQYAMEGADWIDQGGGAVLLINPDDNIPHARNVISSWMKKNQTTARYCLAIVEIDKQNLNTNLFNKKAVREAAAEFTKTREEIAINRAAVKQTDWSMSPEKLSKLTNIEADGARHLIDAWFRQWPEIKRYFDGQQITMLTAENDRLREELDNAEEAKKVLHADLNKLKKELNESDEALSESNTKLDERPSEQPVVKAADELLRFLAGINMQDHSAQEQRDFNSKFSKLKHELMCLGIGSTPGKKV